MNGAPGKGGDNGKGNGNGKDCDNVDGRTRV